MATMAEHARYSTSLDLLLRAMPPGRIDLEQVAAYERRAGRRPADPPEYAERWLLDQQRRAQGR
jgi:hypothetical protein